MPLVVVAYDIANDRRRVKMFKLLRKFGVPIQESLFECHLEEHGIRRLRRRIKKQAHSQDQVRIYTLCTVCAGLITDGKGDLVPGPSDVWVV